MTIRSKLNLSDKTKTAMLTSPEAKLWGKMPETLDLQMEAAKAMLNGETFIRRAMRWVDDAGTGEAGSQGRARSPYGDPIQNYGGGLRWIGVRAAPGVVSSRRCWWFGCRLGSGPACAGGRSGPRPGRRRP